MCMRTIDKRGQALAGSAIISEEKEKLSRCAWFGTDNVDVLYSVSILSVPKCAHSEFKLSSLSTLSALPKRLFDSVCQ